MIGRFSTVSNIQSSSHPSHGICLETNKLIEHKIKNSKHSNIFLFRFAKGSWKFWGSDFIVFTTLQVLWSEQAKDTEWPGLSFFHSVIRPIQGYKHKSVSQSVSNTSNHVWSFFVTTVNVVVFFDQFKKDKTSIIEESPIEEILVEQYTYPFRSNRKPCIWKFENSSNSWRACWVESGRCCLWRWCCSARFGRCCWCLHHMFSLFLGYQKKTKLTNQKKFKIQDQSYPVESKIFPNI